jgi:hypothetical protein
MGIISLSVWESIFSTITLILTPLRKKRKDKREENGGQSER